MEARDKSGQMIQTVRPKNKSYLIELEMGSEVNGKCRDGDEEMDGLLAG